MDYLKQALYSSSQIRTIEQGAARQLPPGTLMQRAGKAAAEAAIALLGRLAAPPGAKVLLLAGPGNNGGDALEAAAHLAQAGYAVTVWLAPPGTLASPEREAALARARASSARLLAPFAAVLDSESWALVIDGLFGIGAGREFVGETRRTVVRLNQLTCPVLALDVPSGLNADTGSAPGADGLAVRASHTITFIGDKPGLHTCDGQDHAGQVEVADLQISSQLFPAPQAHLNSPHHFAWHLRARRQNSHKGSFGSVAVLGGAAGMRGAAILAARAALYGGAGRVHIAFPDNGMAYDSAQPEIMCRMAEDVDFRRVVLVAGPGLGDSHRAGELLQHAIDSGSPLLLDADALNLVAVHPELHSAVSRRGKSTVLTPHPLEAARLLGLPVNQVQSDRLGAARKLALRLQATVVLKGSGSIIAGADGSTFVNTTGNPALATAGTGDVLSGLCGALLAQGWPEQEAVLGAVWLHGSAADTLVADGHGPIGMTAQELMPALRQALNRLVRN